MIDRLVRIKVLGVTFECKELTSLVHLVGIMIFKLFIIKWVWIKQRNLTKCISNGCECMLTLYYLRNNNASSTEPIMTYVEWDTSRQSHLNRIICDMDNYRINKELVPPKKYIYFFFFYLLSPFLLSKDYPILSTFHLW